MKKSLIILLTLLVVFTVTSTCLAETKKLSSSSAGLTMPEGTAYKWSDERISTRAYIFSMAESHKKITGEDGSAVIFQFAGNIRNNGKKNNIPAYDIESNSIVLSFQMNSKYFSKMKSLGWVVSYDKAKHLNGEHLTNAKGQDWPIGYGAVVFQTSDDGKTWWTYDKINIGLDKGINCKSQTSCMITRNLKSVDSQTGAFFRIVILYELKDTKKSFSYKNYAEVYQFYVYNSESAAKPAGVQTDIGKPNGISYMWTDDSISQSETYLFSKAETRKTLVGGNGDAMDFQIQGNIHNDGTKNGYPIYSADDNDITFRFLFDQEYFQKMKSQFLTVGSDSSSHFNKEHLTGADGKDWKIENGALLLQVSSDGNTWMTSNKIHVNLDKTAGQETQSGRTVTMQPKAAHLNKGSFFRVVLLYELKATDLDWLLVKKNYAELYTFYIYNSEVAAQSAGDYSGQSFVLGKRIKTTEDFYHSLEMQQSDPHYGWELGKFVISGFTEHREENGTHVFLKNVGDEIRLGFRLDQDIDALNGNPKLRIASDLNMTDLYFELPTTNFRRGLLIIQQTDYRNITLEPVKHVNFLEAEVQPFTDTQIGLYEEGDYLLKLDYSIGSNHYTITDSFSIRNSNCIVYIFDTHTTSELLDGSYTDTGFYLDLAFSRYLNINVKREALINGRLDMRENQSAKDLEAFTKPGVYTITVANKVTGEMTVKTIYVGRDYRQLWEDYWK